MKSTPAIHSAASAIAPSSRSPRAMAWSWRLWRSVASARRRGASPAGDFVLWGGLAACAAVSIAMPLGPEGWRARLATLAASLAWWALPLLAAWRGAAGLRGAERSGALDDLSLASPGVEERGLGALVWSQGAGAAALAAMLGVALIAAFSLLSARLHAGSANPLALAERMIGPMPIAAAAFVSFGVSLAGRRGWSSAPGAFPMAAACAAYWTIYALALPRLFAYPAAFAMM